MRGPLIVWMVFLLGTRCAQAQTLAPPQSPGAASKAKATAGQPAPGQSAPGQAAPSLTGQAPTSTLAPPTILAPLSTSRPPQSPMPGSQAVTVLSVNKLIEMARRESPVIAQGRAGLAESQAGILSAQAWPNPEVELMAGRSQARDAQGQSGPSPQFALTQPLEWPALRTARTELAQRRVLASQAQILVTDRELVAAIRRACADILRLGEEEAAAADDLALAEQIRSRIGLSARAGEVPRFDLTRAEAEVAIARKVLETTRIRNIQASFELRRVVGVNFPEPFRIDPEGALPERVGPQDFERLWASVEVRNPELALAQAELGRKQQELVFERSQVVPRVTLRASRETDPNMAATRMGATVVIPLWDQRAGQIAQGAAAAERARAAVDLKRLEVVNGFESAWRAWLAAEAQLRALDSGIVARAREILNTAEAAYRFGERGILETLDAQRQFRAVRLELIAARHTMALSRIELERLTGL